MIRSKALHVAVITLIALAFSIGALAQKTASEDAILESIRADMRADKVALVTEAMRLSAAEGEKFWPVYREYEKDLAGLNDKRIALYQSYGQKFATMTDTDAKSLADNFFAWEAKRTQLKKDYFAKFTKATSAITAAKFFQVEHRLDLLLDLDLAAQVPGLFIKGAPDGNTGDQPKSVTP